MTWTPRTPEILVPFDPREERLYRDENPTCVYHGVRWPLRRGRGKYGEFPLIVVREHFRTLGYTVWASEPELPDGSGFILVSYPGKRRNCDPAFLRMAEMFGEETVEELNERADRLKQERTKSAGGGDPDLFVFRDSERFFVEVKWNDDLTLKQHLTFPLIEKMCDVEIRVARIYPADSSHAGSVDR